MSRNGLAVVAVALAAALCPRPVDGASAEARRILTATGVRGGLVVHLGCGDGRLTAALRASDAYVVHGLARDAAAVAGARETIRTLGLYGPVSVDRLVGPRLPYADNLVDLVVAEALGDVPMAEVMRVLSPGGVAYIKRGEQWAKSLKPRPKAIDEWTHALYDPSNNAVSRDRVVGPPRGIQWVGPPRRARQHERLASISAVVAAGGRVFSIQDEGSVAAVVLPSRWFLVARDAFNGVLLWKRAVGPWEKHLRGFRSGPPDLMRRLVAVGGTVYATLGYGAPVTALDAATGETARTYDGTANTHEILFQDDILYLVVWDGAAAGAATRRGAPSPQTRRILALRADTGKTVWQKADADTASLMPLTLAVAAGRVYFQNLREVVCLDAAAGEEAWRAKRPVAKQRPTWSAPTLVVYGGVVVSADRALPAQVAKEPKRRHPARWIDSPTGEMVAFAAGTGAELWRAPCREGFHASPDILIADGLLWTGEVAHASDPGITVGRDPRTGEIGRRRPPDKQFFNVGMSHHRCHRNRATERYLVLSRAGVELIDVASGRGIAHHWTRGTCAFGVLPCNGLLYAPPHSCACYSTAKVNGFWAYAAKPALAKALMDKLASPRLEKGPAYASSLDTRHSTLDTSASWPTYRHDAARSGATPTAVPTALQRRWQAALGGELSSVTVADGKVFVARVDRHSVHALDSAKGREAWRFTAGGRVDSPPTFDRGRVLFGCADGWVYCLRAADGQLAWRFRAAPADRRVVAYGQLESIWPVHGSVLVTGGVATFAAGRSSYIDGGILLYRLDAGTGEMLSRTVVDSRDPETGLQPKGVVQQFDLPGALPDVLSGDGTSVFMRHVRFDREGVRQQKPLPHLYSPTGFLDDTWWHRSYWIYGTRFYTGYRDWFRAGREVPGGRILVFDAEAVYGCGRKPEYYYWSTPLEYHLFGADKRPKLVPSPTKRPRVPAWGQTQIAYRWRRDAALHVRALVLAGGTLFAAGPPDVLDEEQAWRHRGDDTMQDQLASQQALLDGKGGARLVALSAQDGEPLAEHPLDAPPVFDGMAAAGGRLYLATVDGKVLCLGGGR